MPDSGPEIRLSRNLGLFTVTMMGVGGMIGAGIFALTGIVEAASSLTVIPPLSPMVRSIFIWAGLNSTFSFSPSRSKRIFAFRWMVALRMRRMVR